jgi:hypothetical protein
LGGELGTFARRGQLSRVRTVVSNEQLLNRLNGQIVTAASNSWRLEVYSIIDKDAHRWVQVGLEGTDRRTVLLKLEYMADEEDAIDAVQDWVRSSSAVHGGVVTVSDSD